MGTAEVETLVSLGPNLGDNEFIGDRYRLVAVAGEGGVATVWQAVDTTDGATVALKILHSSASDLETIQRLALEVEILRRLRHPAIVRVRETGVTSDGAAFIVMEWVDGHMLRRLIRASADGIELNLAIDVIGQIAGALAEAHAHDVVHRDLKPENILLCGRMHRSAKVLDFGMAKILHTGAPNVTVGDVVFGTPEYMAPERAKGKPVTGAADIYALGVLSYELLTGRRPFYADHPFDLMKLHVTEPPPPMREIAPPLNAVVLAALAKDPTDRPDAADYSALLHDAGRHVGAC